MVDLRGVGRNRSSLLPTNEVLIIGFALSYLAIAPVVDASGCANVPSDCMEGCYFGGGTVSCGLGCVARVCLPVGQGFYSPAGDNSRYPCPLGEYSDNVEGQVCMQCPEDTYQDSSGQDTCKSCPPGTFTNDFTGRDSLADCILLPETSQPSEKPSLSSSASPSHESSDVPSLEPSTEATSLRSGSPSEEPTITSSHSNGSSHPSLTPSASMSPSSRNDTTSSNVSNCPAGHTGQSCEQCCDAANMDADDACIEQYFYKDGACAKCPSIGSSILVGVSTLVIFVCIFVAYRYMNTATPAMFYIGVDYLQILSFLGTTALSWPRTLNDALSILAIINFDLDAFLPLECLFGIDHELKTITILVSPLAVSLIITLIAFFASAVCRVHQWSNRMIGVALGVMYFACLYPCSTAVDALTSGSRLLLLFGVGAICLYAVSFPVLIIYILTRRTTVQAIKAEESQRECSRDETCTRTVDTDILRQRFGFLFGAYRSKRWYWSVVVLVRKLWLVVATEVWGRRGNPITLGCVLTGMFALSGFANYRCRPYMMLAQEMTFMAKQLGMDDDEDNNVIDDTKYRSITMRWNVDLFLHASLCIMAVIGTVSSGLDGDMGWKSEIALSLSGFAILGASFYLLVWAIFSEISRMVRFSPKSKKNITAGSGLIVRRLSASLRSSINGGSEIVPTNDEPQKLHIPIQAPPPPGPPPPDA